MRPVVKNICIVILILLIVGGGFLFNRYQKKQKYVLPTSPGNGQEFGITGLYGDEEYQMVAAMGAKWVRPQLVWQNLQKENQPIDFERLDDLYAQSQKYGLKVMISLRTGHQQPWPTKCDLNLCEEKPACPDPFSSCPPASYDEYRNFTRELAAHFKGKVEYFIIENEVNTLTFWNGTKEEYLKLRRSAYEGIHSGNPNAVVLDNGIASEAWVEAVVRDKFCREGKEATRDFLTKVAARRYGQEKIDQALDKLSCVNGQPVLDRGGEITKAIFTEPATFDALAFHYYEPSVTQAEVIGWVKNQMAALGYSKPIYNTEGGVYDISSSHKDQQAQDEVARELVKTHVINFSEGLKTLIWLPEVQRVKNGKYEPYWGLYDQSNKILPAGVAYKNLISKIGGFDEVIKLDLKDVEAYLVDANSKKLLIVWSDSTVDLDLNDLPINVNRATDYLGNNITINNTALRVENSPLYLE